MLVVVSVVVAFQVDAVKDDTDEGGIGQLERTGEESMINRSKSSLRVLMSSFMRLDPMSSTGLGGIFPQGLMKNPGMSVSLTEREAMPLRMGEEKPEPSPLKNEEKELLEAFLHLAPHASLELIPAHKAQIHEQFSRGLAGGFVDPKDAPPLRLAEGLLLEQELSQFALSVRVLFKDALDLSRFYEKLHTRAVFLNGESPGFGSGFQKIEEIHKG